MTLSKRSNRNIIFDAIRHVRKGYSLPDIAEIAVELQNMGYDDVSIREIQKVLAYMESQQLARRKKIDGSRCGRLAELLGLPGTSAPEISP